MALALDELVRGTLLPDRFTDAAEALAGNAVLADEILPRRDDASGVGSDIRHVREHDRVRFDAQCGLELRDLVARFDDQDWFAGPDAVADEGNRAFEEFGPAGVQEGLVAKSIDCVRVHGAHDQSAPAANTTMCF